MLSTDAVPVRCGSSSWEKDWPQEGGCLRRDDVQEGMFFLLIWYFVCLVLASRFHHPHFTALFFCLFSASRPPPLHCKGPSSWVLVILLATSVPSLREMCWCRTSMLWKAFSFPGGFAQVDSSHLFLQCFKYLLLCLILLHTVKVVTSHQPTITQTLGLKPTPPWPSATSESYLGSDQMTTLWVIYSLWWFWTFNVAFESG